MLHVVLVPISDLIRVHPVVEPAMLVDRHNHKVEQPEGILLTMPIVEVHLPEAIIHRADPVQAVVQAPIEVIVLPADPDLLIQVEAGLQVVQATIEVALPVAQDPHLTQAEADHLAVQGVGLLIREEVVVLAADPPEVAAVAVVPQEEVAVAVEDHLEDEAAVNLKILTT